MGTRADWVLVSKQTVPSGWVMDTEKIGDLSADLHS